MLLKFSINSTHDHTQARKQRKKSKKPRETLLSHPPYTPDLAPSGSHLFGALKVAICGKMFGSDDEVMKR
jgi:hypothetical protein